LHLDTQLLNELAIGQPLPLPDSFAALGSCFRHPDGTQGFYLQSVSGPSGANLLARFCHADERLAERVQNHLRAEEKLDLGDALFADCAVCAIAVPNGVLCRPVCANARFRFWLRQAHPIANPLSDLTVSLLAIASYSARSASAARCPGDRRPTSRSSQFQDL
jgi:hypothetical protein